MKKILSLLICMFLLVSLIGPVYALNKETYDKMDFWSKLKYNFYTGKILIFTSWGQANCCSEQPDKEKTLEPGDRIDCDDYCSYDKCAIDIWYDSYIYLGNGPSHPIWSRLVWYKEEAGERESFTASSTHQYWFVQVYCCPENCVLDDHSTRAYVCERGIWDYKGRYDKDEYCEWDTSGIDLCWCSDDDDRFYIDESGFVHCRGSPRDSWCTAYIVHHYKSCLWIGGVEYLYWYDSEGNRNDLIETCTSDEACTTTGCVKKPDCHGTTELGSASYCSPSCKCKDGEGDCDGLGTDDQCESGLICMEDVGANYGFSASTDVCETPGFVTCAEEGESCGYSATAPLCCSGLDCQNFQCVQTGECSPGQTKCGSVGDVNQLGQVYYTCIDGTFQSQGRVDGECGYTLGVCNTEADTNCDGVVDRVELGSYITKWINGQVTRTKLGQSIQVWASS